VFVMCHGDAGVPRNHVVVHRQYCRLLEVHPRHLKTKHKIHCPLLHSQ
jgi:hypothetical protein